MLLEEEVRLLSVPFHQSHHTTSAHEASGNGEVAEARINSDEQVEGSSIALVSVLRSSASFTTWPQNSYGSCSNREVLGSGSDTAFLRQRVYAGLWRLRGGMAASQTEVMPALTLEMPGMAGSGTHSAHRA